MNIERRVSCYLNSNMYILQEFKHAILIDPFESSELLYNMKKNGIRVDGIFITHEHFDHISGVNWWKDKMDAKVVCGNACSENIQNARKNMSHYFDAFCEIQTWLPVRDFVHVEDYTCNAEYAFMSEKIINWQGHILYMRETPGHSEGSCCLLVDEKYLFCGDSLMKDYPIEVRLKGGSSKDWNMISKPWLRSLAGDVKVYPGHFEEFQLYEYKFWEE